MFRDAHHSLFNRQEWSMRPEAKKLRETPTLITKMERSDHDLIHRHCPPVPLLGYYALVRTLHTFQEGDNSLESIENLMRAIEKSSTHPKTHEIERRLSDLAVWSLDLQRPFIADVLRRNSWD